MTREAALREALEHIAAPGCGSWHFYEAIACEEPHAITDPVEEAGWDYCLDPNNREDEVTGDPAVDRCHPCLARAALASAPSDPEPVAGLLGVLRDVILEWAYDYLEANREPCRFDHHGGCQAHGYLEPDEPYEDACPEGNAQDAYATLRRHLLEAERQRQVRENEPEAPA